MINNLNNIVIVEEEIKSVKLTKEEKRKLKVIKRLINGEFNGTKAAKMLKDKFYQKVMQESFIKTNTINLLIHTI